jgi:hypothetical protein
MAAEVDEGARDNLNQGAIQLNRDCVVHFASYGS